MSLFDISKDDPMRSIPAPNTNDSVTNRLAHGTTQNHNAGEEALADGLKFAERQIIAKQDSVNKALFGFLPSTGKFGLRVAEDGVDVETAADDQLIFNSDNNIFKIVMTGTGSLTVPAVSTGTTQVTHGLGYSPLAIVFGEVPGGGKFNIAGSYWNTLPTVTAGSVTFADWVDYDVDGFNLTIAGYNGTPTPLTLSFRYYLLQETAN